MEGRLIAFVIWVIIGVLFIVMGIYDFNSKKAKPFGFWANAEVSEAENMYCKSNIKEAEGSYS